MLYLLGVLLGVAMIYIGQLQRKIKMLETWMLANDQWLERTNEQLAQMRDALDRNSAIATAALAIILVSVGAVLGYRDYLPKKIVATTTIGIGVLGIVAGVGTLGWVGYNLFVERQKEFHPGRLGLPFIMIAVGYGFVRKGISALK